MTELDEALHAASLLEVTTRRLRAEILSGDLAPGQRIVEEHGGTIRASSRPEGGAVMTMRLPVAS